MDEIEVEAVEEIGRDVGVSPGTAEYVLYGGKGGVGKTTMAAATGLASAEAGTPTLVVSTDPAHSLSDTLETDVPSRPGRLRDDAPLYGVEIDPDEALRRTDLFDADGGMAGPMGDLEGLLGGTGEDGEDGHLGGGMVPGADEAAAMQLLVEYLDDERFERVVVDTAPTGHTLRLLELPELLDSMIGRMLQFRRRVSGVVENLKGAFGGGNEEGAERLATGADLDELKARVERLRSVLRDPERTDFRVVLVPEEMSVLESERLVARLDEFDVPVGTVVVNRVMEPLTEVADAAAVGSPAADGEAPTGEAANDDAVSDETASGDGSDEADGLFVTPDLDACAFCRRRWDVQQSALAEAQDLFRGHDVKRVPLFADEVRGERALRAVAACLA